MASSQGTVTPSQGAVASTQGPMTFKQRIMPYIAVLLLQLAYAGSAIISKSAIERNMSPYTYAVYSSVFAAVVLAPLSFFLERNNRPAMTRPVMLRILLLGLLELVADRILYHVALKHATATFANSMTNMIPAMAFVLAWALRLEQVDLSRLRDQMKFLGTIFIVAGACIMTFVNGATIRFPWTKDDHGRVSDHYSPPAGHPVTGAIMITAACLCCAIFYILQGQTRNMYPAEFSLTSMVCAAGALQASVVSLIAERNHLSVWSIRINFAFLAYAYGGIITTAVGFYVTVIITGMRGAVFVTSFNPVSMVIVALLSSLFLGEKLNWGRVGGASVIIVGLYLIVWGRSRDNHTSSSSNPNGDQADRRADQPSLEAPTLVAEPSLEAPTVVAEPSLEEEIQEIVVAEPSLEEEIVVAEASSGDEIVELDE